MENLTVALKFINLCLIEDLEAICYQPSTSQCAGTQRPITKPWARSKNRFRCHF